MSAAQIIAVVIFLAMFVMIVMDKVERQYVTLVSGGLVIAIVFGLCMHSTEAIMNTFRKKVPMDFPVLMDRDGQVSKAWKVYAFPSSFLNLIP